MSSLLLGKRRATFGVVVPAYNEERVIEDSLRSLLKVLPKRHIFVVSDGSTDKTVTAAKRVVPNVLNLRKNRGKAGALQALLKKYQLTSRYKYLFFFDADSRIDKDFLKIIRRRIQDRPACIVGTVTSLRNNVISAYRVYEYGFSHLFYKNAQNVMGTIVVAPGCASVYRTDVLDQLDFSRKTLTEDFDFTIQIHKKKLGKVVYVPAAKVLTQDPQTFGDYWNQITRWNTGFWQNFFAHKLYLPTSTVNGEILLLIIDTITWLVILGLVFSRPILTAKLYVLSLALAMIIGVIVAIIRRQYWAIVYSPVFGLFQIVNLGNWVYSFFRAISKPNRLLPWQKVSRYSISN